MCKISYCNGSVIFPEVLQGKISGLFSLIFSISREMDYILHNTTLYSEEIFSRKESTMYHKIFIAGNLGQDPELRYTSSGHTVTKFSVATQRVWRDGNGQKQEQTIWWRVSVFGKQAEACSMYLQKGRPVLIEGRMNPDPDTGGPRLWTGHDGVVRASFEITAIDVRFIGGRGDSAGEPAGVTSMESELPEEEDPPF